MSGRCLDAAKEMRRRWSHPPAAVPGFDKLVRSFLRSFPFATQPVSLDGHTTAFLEDT